MKLEMKFFIILFFLISFVGCGTGHYLLNTGSYKDNYIRVVGSNADFLIHPTGQYPAKNPQKYEDIIYQPVYREVDNMEQAILEMREKGYVMIGYSAVNSRERGEKPCDRKALSPQGYNNCVLNLRLNGIDPNQDPLGNPYHAAIWANATEVIVQKNYSFSRQEMQQVRIVTDEGGDVSSSSGFSEGGHRGRWGSSTYGQSNTKGDSSSSGNFDQSGSEVHADAGGSGFMGPTGNVGGSMNESSGSNRGQSQYGEKSKFQTFSAGGSSGTSYQDTGNVTENYTKHWATALVAKQVDHYDYMATYWKKADLRKVAFGVITENVPRDLWQALGTRSARRVSAVIGGSPAYLAEIWEGDILVAVNSEKIVGETGFTQLVTMYQGSEAVFTVWRGGNFYDVKVQLNRRI